jgi:hypothetical protein
MNRLRLSHCVLKGFNAPSKTPNYLNSALRLAKRLLIAEKVLRLRVPLGQVRSVRLCT